MSVFQNLQQYMLWNTSQTKSEVAKKPKNPFSNGIVWNAYDTYKSVIFNKRLILNTKNKDSNLNREEILRSLEGVGLNTELFKTILRDIIIGGGGGITVYNEKIEYLSAYEPMNCDNESFDYRKSKILTFKGNDIYYYKTPIQGSYFIIRKDYDDFNNFYSCVDKCLVQLLDYAETSHYSLGKSRKGFEREMFYQIDSEILEKIGENDSDAVRLAKNERNKHLFEHIKERMIALFARAGKEPRIIQSAITPVPVDTEIQPESIVKKKEGLIEEIAYAFGVSASSLGMSNSANRSQSESDRDALAEQAINYTNIFVECANYWLRQFYPDHKDELYFTWQENETDESLALREQNLQALEFYTTNSAILENLGIEADKNKLVELANSVSIPDLFRIADEKADNNELEQSNQNFSFVDVVGEIADTREAIDDSKLAIKSVEIATWESRNKVKKAKKAIENKLKSYIQSQLDKTKRSKIDFENFYPREEFKDSLESLARGVVDLYNERNVSQFSLLDNILDYVNQVTELTYSGDGSYLGIYNTIDSAVEKGWKLNQVFNQVQTNLQSSLYVPLFNEVQDKIAIEDGASHIATVAKNDKLVRKHHLDNARKIWRLSDKAYWLEPNCRCNRFYGSVKELTEAGFTNPNNY